MSEAASSTVVELTFPLGSYNAQASNDFARPEWPPHPVRLLAALISAAESLPEDGRAAARAAIDLLAAAPPPVIVAPRCDREADGVQVVAAFRGASRWAPRNPELGELVGGLHPREVGRDRAAVEKGGVAIGDRPVRFVWDVTLDEAEFAGLARAAGEMTWLGSSRSPVVAFAERSEWAPSAAWLPDASTAELGVDVRVPTRELRQVLDRQHERRRGSLRRGGAPARALFVPPASLGRWQRYVHSANADDAAAPPVDPEHWGEMLVLAVDRMTEVWPKAPAAYAFARATRRALLSRFGAQGTPQEAPPILTARGGDPHAAVVPLPDVGHPHADGRIIGVAVLLAHPRRMPDVMWQRRRVERGIAALLAPCSDGRRTMVGTPGIGNVLLGSSTLGRTPLTLQPWRWRRPSRVWATVTPVVHSHYRRSGRIDALLEQVSADCRDVSLPEPECVETLRLSRFHGAPPRVIRRDLPDAWRDLLRGPIEHLEVTFPKPVHGPVILGRARHFGLGLCLPVDDT